jgi:plasmid stability protein
MPNLTIKNLPQELYELLKRRAADHRRSINGEVIVCLEQALQKSAVDPEAFLADLDRLHREHEIPPVTEETLHRAKRRHP